MSEVGPHLLGWKRPDKLDERDVRMSQVFALENDTKFNYSTDVTIQQGIDLGWFSTRRLVLAFYKWIKTLLHPTPPTPPTPTPDPLGPTSMVWHDPMALDQGNTPHCVGFASTHFLDADPVEDNLLADYAHALYYDCKILDKEPGVEDGTMVSTAVKVLRTRGRIDTYVAARSVQELKPWVLTHGTVILGLTWYDSMFDPDANGFVFPTGKVAGGHSFLIVGYDSVTDVFEFQNSWGLSWGKNGHFFMHAADLETLLQDNGEAFATTELPLAALRAAA